MPYVFSHRRDIYHTVALESLTEALPQGQPGAAGTSGVKGQKVSDTGMRCSTHSGCICASLSAQGKQREGNSSEVF